MARSFSKSRQMMRSILPSNRNHANSANKNKASQQRKRRRKAQALIDNLDEYTVDAPAAEVVTDIKLRRNLKYVVMERRSGDKLAHFQRWAVRLTKNMPRKDRVSYMRSLMPAGTIGEHAIGHLESLSEFKNLNDLSSAWYSRYQDDQIATTRKRELRSRRVRDRVRVWVEEGLHSDINAVARAVRIDVCKGIHDIDAFYARLRKSPKWEGSAWEPGYEGVAYKLDAITPGGEKEQLRCLAQEYMMADSI